MNRFKHFPASEMMTEFEIVEIQNEMLRQRKIQKELEQDSTPEDSESEEDSSTKESSTMIDSQNIDLSDNDMISDMTEEEFSMDNHVLSLQSSEDDLLNNISLESLVNSQPSKTNSDSNDSNQSFKTPPNSISSLLDESKNSQHKDVIPIEFNNIKFLTDLNKANTKQGPVGSTVRMGFQSKQLNEFFICHLCDLTHFPSMAIHTTGIPTIGKGNKDLKPPQDRTIFTSPSPPKFPRNIGAFISHLERNHWNTSVLTIKANNLLTRIILQIQKGNSPLFRYPKCIRKSASSSCVRTRWKSNQTNLTFNMAQHYVANESECRGHTQDLFTEGRPYENDWAQSIYCTCGAKNVEESYGPETMDDEIPPISNQAHFQDHTIIGLPSSFFAYNETSILYQHKTIRCPFRLDCGPIKKIPLMDIGVKTRQMTTQNNLVQTNHTEEKEEKEKHKSPVSKTPPPITENESQKTPIQTTEKTKKGATSTNFKKAAVSAVRLLKPAGTKKKADELSKQ